MDPSTRRELEALDAALAGRPVDPRDEDLASLAVALREERPLPRPEFALDLDLRVRDGFPTPEAAATARSPRRRRTWGLALGTAASLFIVATAIFSSGALDSDGGTGQPGQPDALDVPAADSGSGVMTPLSKGGSEEGARLAPSGPGVRAPGRPSAPSRQTREIERAASLTLATPRDQIEDTADAAIKVTDRHGGIVMSSNVSVGDDAAGATLDLRLPTDRLQAAIADLSDLGHVRSRTQESADITAAFTSPRRRLSDALAERRGLLRQLGRAVTANETAAVRARLRAVNRRIDRAQAELRRLRDRVSFAAVSVAIEPGAGSGDGGGWSLGDAADDALGVLRALLGGALVALAVLVPAGLLGGGGWLAYRGWVRRRRESALEM